MTTKEIHGHCNSRFEPVREAFSHLIESTGELGAACAIYRQGELAVNLWAGTYNKDGDPWQQNTLVNVFSVSKAVTAICVQKAVELGALQLERPVIDYWPEYGRNGKKRTLVSWFLNHRAGQPAMKTPLSDVVVDSI